MPGYDPKFYLFQDLYDAQCEEAMRVTANVYYEVVGKIFTARETGKAIFMRVDFIDGTPIIPSSKQWFPKSQISDIDYGGVDGELGEGSDSIQATEWILEQKSLLKNLRGQRVAKDVEAQERQADRNVFNHIDDIPDLDDAPF